jgi:hypothetical protein
MALKQLKTIYDQNPDDTDTLYKLAELHNNLGQHDLAYEAYAALEGKLKTIGEKEASDPNNPNKRPDYVEQRQLPAVAGMAYTQELLGNKAEAQRLKGISESRGYKGQEFSSVGAGEALQPGNDMVYNDQGQMVPVGSPTPESEYLNGIAQAIENFTLFGPANEMTNVGFDKLAKNLPGAFDPYGLPSDKIAKTVGVITGAVETLMGVAGMTTPAGALFAMPLVEVQNVAPEVAKWMMPLSVVLNEYYRQQGEKMPEMMENVTVLADLGILGFLTHQGVEGAKGLKAERDLKKVFENPPPELVEQLAKVGEKRIEMAQGDPKVYGEQMALRLDELKPQVEEIKMQAEAAKPVEPYQAPEQPTTLSSIKDGTDIMMDGKEGVLEYGDDMTPYFVDSEGKSTQIKVADKANPIETLSELGIQVLPEITPEQIARASADAEMVGKVKFRGKEYFVSLDRVGNETPTGDHVFRVMPDGTMVDVFDSSPKPIKKFSQERKLEIINEFLESKGLPKRDKLTSTKLVEETPTQEQPSTLEIKPIENEKVNQEGRQEGLLDTPPLEQPLAPVAEKPTPNEPVSPAVEVSKVEPVTPPKPPRVESEIETKVRELKQDVLNIGYEIGYEMEKNSLAEFSPDMYAVQNMPWIKPESAAKETGGRVGSKGDINPSMVNKLKGVSVEKAGEILEQRAAEDGLHPHLDSQDWRNIVIEILQAGSKESYIKNNTKFGKERTRALKQDMAEKKAELAEAIKDLENADWEKLGFDSKKEFKQHVRDIKSGKQLEQYEMDAMDVVAQMDDAAVDRMLKELDENYPITEEEINKFYEKHNIEEGSVSAEVSSTEITEGNTAEGKAKTTGEGELTPTEPAIKSSWESNIEALTDPEKGLGAVFSKLIKEQQPFKESFLKRIGLSLEEMRQLDDVSKQKIQDQWIKSDEFKELSKFVEDKPKPTTPDTPLKITSKEKALKAVDDLENFLLNLPGIKDNVGGERMGAPFKAEDAVKFFAEALREGVEQGYKVKEAIERAIGKLKEHKTYKALLDSVDESMLRDNARKNYEKQGVSLDKPVEQQFGASHASVAEVRKVMGIEDSVPISERVKRDVKTVMEEGRELASKIDLEELSDQVIYDGRSLNANEQAALVFRETELYNEIKDAENSLSKAVASGKKDAADLAQTRIDIAYKQQTAIMQALDIAGSEMGLAFRMRQVMNKRDYSLVSLEKRWTQASGGAKMPADVRKQFSDMVKDLEAKNKRYEELLELKDKQLAEQALANIQESMGRSGKPTDKVKAGEKLRRLADRIEAGKISRLGGYKTSTGFDAVYDLSLTAVAETLRATGKLADAIESGIKKIRETDWYKDLTDKNDFETKYREHLNKEYEKQDYDAPSMNEKGDLILDNQMLRDVVESLEVDPKLKQKNPQEFIDKVHEIVKEEFPDIERRKVQDAISGYGKKINSSLDDLQREVNSLKRDLKGISGLEDAKAGKGVLKSGYSPPKPTPMQREQQREIHKELKNHPQDQASLDKKWATALDRTKSALRNSITDLTKRIEDIKAGTATPKTPREKLKLDNEAEMMQEVVDDLKQQLIDLEGKKTLSIEQRIDMAIQGAERTRELYERRTKEIRDTGTYTRDTPVELSSPELTIARQIRDAAKAKYEAARDASPGEKSIAEQTKAARDLSASEKRVADLENKIKKNQISYAAKAQRAMFKTPELEASLAKEKALNQVINTMREEQGLVDAHARDLWKARKQRQIAEIERRIREKDYTKKVKPELELDIEMERIQAEMDRKKFDLDVMIEKEKARSKGFWGNLGENISDVVNMPKSLMASADLSAPLRQGAILSARHPVLATRAFKEMINQFLSGKEAQKWHDDLIRTDGYIRAKKSGLFISEPMARLVAKEEAFMSNLAEKIPVYGRFVKGSNRAYSAFLNKMRMDVFNQHHKALMDAGFKGEVMKKELEAMAYLINNFTGRGGLGKAEIAAPLLNSLFFAPRFVKSRLNILADTASGFGLIQGGLAKTSVGRGFGLKGTITPRARIEAYKAMASYIGMGWTVLQLAKLAGADVEADPRSSDFGKIKIGDTRYDIWAGLQQPAVLFSRLKTQATKSTRTGKITPLGEGYKADDGLDVLGRFMRTKTSPQLSTFLSHQSGEFMDRKPFSWAEAAKGMVIPLVYQDLLSAYQEKGVGGAVDILPTLPPSLFGVGVQTYDPDPTLKDSNIPTRSLDLMKEKHFAPQDHKDDEVYVKGKPYIIPEDKMVKIKEMRAKEAGKLIEKNYWTLKKLTDEEYESKVNSYYNKGLKKARNKYLPSGWKNTK